MIDRHVFWEKLLFDEELEEEIARTFVDNAEYLTITDERPDATDVIRYQIENLRAPLHRALNPVGSESESYEQPLQEAIHEALARCPEELIEEVAEYIYRELREENRDVAEWPDE